MVRETVTDNKKKIGKLNCVVHGENIFDEKYRFYVPHIRINNVIVF